MARHSRLLAFISLLFLGTSLHAQSCAFSSWTWLGDYSETGNFNGACPTNQNATCSVNSFVSANVNLSFVPNSCSNPTWNGTDSNFASNLDDSDLQPCSGGGQSGVTYTENGGPSLSSYTLTINVAALTYSFYPEGIASGGTQTITDCFGNKTTDPATVGVTSSPADSTPYNSFVLPPTVQPLTMQNFALTAPDVELDIFMPWIFSFTLTPQYVDCDDCKKNGGMKWPIGSTSSSQNQSLGEDVPIVGTGFNLHYEGSRTPGASGNKVAVSDAEMIGGWTLSPHHVYDPASNTLFLGDGTQRNSYELGTPVAFAGSSLITSEDGSEVYFFFAGQHLETLRPLTGAVEYLFSYDTAGRLSKITDAAGNTTTIQRNSAEQATAIVSPYGQTTNLTVDGNGFLSQLTDPMGKTQTFVNSSGGLLTSRTDANGNTYNYSYDASNRLAQDSDPLGGYVQFSRNNATSGFGWTQDELTSMGRSDSYQTTVTWPWVSTSTSTTEIQHTDTSFEGLQFTSSRTLQNGQLLDSATLPDGTSESATESPDPVWGIQAPVTTSETLTLGNLAASIAGSRKTVLKIGSDPLLVSSETDTVSVNGRTYTGAYTGSTRTWLNTTPVGRTLSVGLDSLERLGSLQIGGLTATDFTYDSHGRLSAATQGTRTSNYAYNSAGFLASVTDPMSLTTSFTYDVDGRLATATLSDGRVIGYSYDANGNLTSITPPGKAAHNFAYNAVDLPTSYTPPTVSGTGATTYAYDLDRDLTTVTRPDGATIKFVYDSAGRTIAVNSATGNASFAYNSTTGTLSGAARGTEKIAYAYNGPLLIRSTWSGTVAGSVTRNYNNNFWVSSEGVGGGSTIPKQYDNDGLLTKAGPMQVTHNQTNSLISGTTVGVVTDSRTYDDFGGLIGYTASINGAPVYTASYTRDADGRVSAKNETLSGTTNNYSYTYDVAGRLTAVTKNATSDTYTYDTNSNRLSATTASGTSNGTYDGQDRLLTYGGSSFAYTANGELTTQLSGTQKTIYKYDVFGNLTAATLPNGNKLAYIVDAENHRVGKAVNGALQAGFLYDENDQIVAQLNGTNHVVSQFVYATGAGSPDYMISGGVVFRIISDQLGSPLVVLNSSTGAIEEQITYDEFGNVLSDSNPGFQPFGFAGGLYDQDTKLVRFGARDYNAAVGRWTAKDRLLFDGGDTNLYGYTLADPVNRIDPTGQDSLSCEEIRKKIRDKVADAKQWIKDVDQRGRDLLQHLVNNFTGPGIIDFQNGQMGVGVSKSVGDGAVEVTATATAGLTNTGADINSKPFFTTDIDLSATFGKIFHQQFFHHHSEHFDTKWNTLGCQKSNGCD